MVGEERLHGPAECRGVPGERCDTTPGLRGAPCLRMEQRQKLLDVVDSDTADSLPPMDDLDPKAGARILGDQRIRSKARRRGLPGLRKRRSEGVISLQASPSGARIEGGPLQSSSWTQRSGCAPFFVALRKSSGFATRGQLIQSKTVDQLEVQDSRPSPRLAPFPYLEPYARGAELDARMASISISGQSAGHPCVPERRHRRGVEPVHRQFSIGFLPHQRFDHVRGTLDPHGPDWTRKTAKLIENGRLRAHLASSAVWSRSWGSTLASPTRQYPDAAGSSARHFLPAPESRFLYGVRAIFPSVRAFRELHSEPKRATSRAYHRRRTDPAVHSRRRHVERHEGSCSTLLPIRAGTIPPIAWLGSRA